MLNIPVRFFTYCINEEFEVDICEISEVMFLKLTLGFINPNPIHYERHTVFNNGVSQICLTVETADYPLQSEVKL